MTEIILPPQTVQFLVSQSTSVATPLPNDFQKTMLNLLNAVGSDTLRSLAREVHFTIGELLLREGESGDFMYLLISGRVLAYSGDLHAPMILGIRGPGEFIGEMSMIDGEPRSATVVAIEPVRALRIDHAGLDTMLQQVPDLNRRLMQILSLRLRQAEAKRSAEQRAGRLVRRQVERLAEEKRALETAQQSRQAMLNFVLHDLRNPINVLYNAIEMLQIMLPDEAVKANQDLFQITQTASERILSLAENLLDIARYEAGSVELQWSEFSIAEMLNNVISLGAFSARTKNITLESWADPTLPSLTADRGRIERVLTNLLDNAIKHTPYDGRISVRVLPFSEAGNAMVVFRVNDTGKGVPQEARERIFEPFVQLDSSAGGLGLGLNYCRLTVQAHGGRIWVEDGENGVGSCFVFTLPLTQG